MIERLLVQVSAYLPGAFLKLINAHSFTGHSLKTWSYSDLTKFSSQTYEEDSDSRRYTQIHRYTDAQIHILYRYIDVQIHRNTDRQIHRCTDIQIRRDADVHIHSYTDTQIHR